jgi:hypothetical protein
MSRTAILIGTMLAGLCAVLAARVAQDADPAPVLEAAANYIASYERDVTAVVAEEDYHQRILQDASSRRLKSDILFIADERNGWIEFRDVFEVDASPVRDRGERISRLFMQPNPNALAQARRIAQESARFNLQPRSLRFNRTLNVPMTALRFLRRQNQARSQFRLQRTESTPAGELAIVRFSEQAMPRIIAVDEDAAARGLFAIDPKTGRVARSELVISNRRAIALIKVEFAAANNLDLWMPATMTEEYKIPGASLAIGGTATYSRFRRFNVDVSTTLK